MEPATSGETRNWLEERVAERDRRVSMYWVFALKDEDRVIGSCCLWNFDRESNRAEIGYELHRDFWKKGFMSEGIPPVLSYGFGDVRLHRIEACPVADNVASTTLLLRLGFKLEGNTRQRVLFRGRYYDQLWYGLLKEEWEAR